MLKIDRFSKDLKTLLLFVLIIISSTLTAKSRIIEPENSPCSSFRFRSQEEWFSELNKINRSNQSVIFFSTVFPDGIQIGSVSRNFRLSSLDNIRDFLPSKEVSKVLPVGTIINPRKGYENELVGELIATKLNIAYNNYYPLNTFKIEDMYCNTGTAAFRGKTVAELVIITDNILGGLVSTNQEFIDELLLILKKLNSYNTISENSNFICVNPTTYNKSENSEYSIFNQNSNSNFTIYPNPAKYEFVVNFSSDSNSIGTLKLLDIAGKIISEEPVYVNTGVNYYKVDLLSKSIKASMVIVEFKYDNEIKRNMVIVK